MQALAAVRAQGSLARTSLTKKRWRPGSCVVNGLPGACVAGAREPIGWKSGALGANLNTLGVSMLVQPRCDVVAMRALSSRSLKGQRELQASYGRTHYAKSGRACTDSTALEWSQLSLNRERVHVQHMLTCNTYGWRAPRCEHFFE